MANPSIYPALPSAKIAYLLLDKPSPSCRSCWENNVVGEDFCSVDGSHHLIHTFADLRLAHHCPTVSTHTLLVAALAKKMQGRYNLQKVLHKLMSSPLLWNFLTNTSTSSGTHTELYRHSRCSLALRQMRPQFICEGSRQVPAETILAPKNALRQVEGV